MIEQRMSNEKLAKMIQAGERDRLMELWEQVRRYAHGVAYRWMRTTGERAGMVLDDFMQAAFLALLATLETWDCAAGSFLTWYTFQLKAAFAEATGRTHREQHDPLRAAVSLDAPLDSSADDPLVLGGTIPDPGAAQALEGVGIWDNLYRAVTGLPEAQRAVIFRRYWLEQGVPEVAAAIGIPAAAVRKLEAAALRTLRHPSVSRLLR